MRYFYLKPGAPQYYFPANYHKYPYLLSLFKPYTSLGEVYWWFWQKFPPLRYFCSITSIEKIFRTDIIYSHVSSNAIMAFNKGTPGPEQKTSVLGFEPDENRYFFMKLADLSAAKENVANEKYILRELEGEVFVPKLLDSKTTNEYALIKTSVFRGEKEQRLLNEKILELLYTLAGMKVSMQRSFKTNLDCCFAHGDFCPWNILETYDGQLKVFDWEMAGSYPLGYDLFTFLFQTNFLLSPKVSFDEIIDNNKTYINEYFSRFNVDNWKQFLSEFAKIKAELEEGKDDKELLEKYRELKKYA